MKNLQATLILQSNEKIHEVDKQESVLKSIDWNQLGSNNPLEDTLAIAELYDSGSNYLPIKMRLIMTTIVLRLSSWGF